MSLLQDIRRRLLGQQAMVMPGQGMGGATQGLIGTGGEIGGGLLQQNLNQINTAEGGILNNIPQSVLLGAALYGQGMQGKDPLEGFFPAVTQSAQLQRLMTPKKEKLMTAYDPKQKKNVFATQSQIEKQGLEPAITGSEMTADQRNFAAYKNIMQTGSAEEKELAKQIFVKGGRDIKSLDEFLLGVTSNLSKDVGVTPEDIQESLPQYEALYNRIIGQVESTTDTGEILLVPENKEDLIDGQIYNVKGQPRKWNKKKNVFE